MSALMARLAALALFLLWNFHAGLHLAHDHCHDGCEENSSSYLVSAEHEDCGACQLSVVPGLIGPFAEEPIPAESEVLRSALADLLPARLYACADGRGPPQLIS